MRYLVFGFYSYYPGGGMEDCILKTDDRAEAFRQFDLVHKEWDYIQVYDTQLGQLFEEPENIKGD